MLAIPKNRKAIGAYAVTGRFNDGERDRGGDGGVNRVAALLQHAESRLCGKRL